MPTTLLAVDDSVTMRKVLEVTFAGEDFRVVTADSADAGLAKLRSERPALVLADLTLDGTNGYGLCSKIKSESPTTLVVLLASKQQPYDAGKGAAAHADDFIEKPFDTQQLIDKVRKALTQPGAAAPAPTAQRPAAATAPAGYSPPAPGVMAKSATGGTSPMGIAVGGARPGVGVPLNPRPTAPGVGHSPIAPAAQEPPAPAAAAHASSVGRGTLSYGPSAAAAVRPPDPAAPTPATGVPRTPAASHAPVPAPSPAAAHAAPAAAATAAVAAAVVNGGLAGKLAGLGLTDAQVTGVLALSREVVERVVWEVVPVLAETMIKEEIRRLTSE